MKAAPITINFTAPDLLPILREVRAAFDNVPGASYPAYEQGRRDGGRQALDILIQALGETTAPCAHRWVSRRIKSPVADVAPWTRVCDHCGRLASEVETSEVDAAVDVIARQVIADLRNSTSLGWENRHPGISDHDWARVADRVYELAGDPRTDDYDKAYALLSGRADVSA